MKQLTYMLAGALLLSATACSSSDEPDNSSPNYIKLTPEERAVSEKLSDFNISLLSTAADMDDSQTGDGNVAVSPFSTTLLLSMAANGMSTADAEKLCAKLGVDNLADLNSFNATVLSSLPSLDRNAVCLLPTALWHTPQVAPGADFNLLMQTDYLTGGGPLDFSNTTAAKQKLSTWIKDATKGLISSYPLDVDPTAEAMLNSAAYFGAPWSNTFFKENLTATATFHGTKGDTEVDMMKGYGEIWAHQYMGHTYVAIPFGNGAFRFEIILPKENWESGSGVTGDIATALPLLRDRAVKGTRMVSLPKFKISQNSELSALLKRLGIDEAVANATYSQFQPTITGELTLSQYAEMSINETGVKAQTVSDATLAPTSPPEPNVGDVVVDSPFYFIIREMSSKVEILSGRIMNLP